MMNGCSRQTTKPAITSGASAQNPSPSSTPPLNSKESRLKRIAFGDGTVVGDNELREAWGIWTPESNDPKKSLVFPEQVKIECTHANMTCREITVPLGLINGMIEIMDIEDNKTWQIDDWDANGLTATYGPAPRRSVKVDSALGPGSEECHRHVLTMSFASKAVSTSDIPTHEKGCEIFTETDSYRLIEGNYYIDISPGNDTDKK